MTSSRTLFRVTTEIAGVEFLPSRVFFMITSKAMPVMKW